MRGWKALPPEMSPAGRAGRAVSRVLFPRARTREDGHLSGTVVADRLEQPTRGSPLLALGGFWCGSHLAAYLALLRLGVTVPPSVAGGAVGSYPTFSPLPPLARGRCLFCGPVRRLAAPRCYLAVYPVELGLSSEPKRSRDHPAR